MNFMSFLGDGEVYFYFMLAIFFLGGDYAFSYLTSAFFMNQHWINWLKTVIRASRPQFDEPSLGIENESQ